MPEQAIQYGLVHEVRAQLIPANAGMTVIYEDASVFSYAPAPIQTELTVEPVTGPKQAETAPVAEAFTMTPSGFTGD